MRSSASTIIRTRPTGIASVRQVIETSSVGVMTMCSSSTWVIEGGRIITRKARLAASAIASNWRCAAGDSLFTKVVMRRFSPRRNASALPSTASQRNRMEASSSDHTSGRWNT
jgi:hypothetical protein